MWFPNSAPYIPVKTTEDLVLKRWFDTVYRFLVGSTRSNNTVQTASFTAGNYFHYPVDCSGGDVTVTLPLAAIYNYKQYVFQKIGGTNTLFVQRSGSDLINGATSTSIISSYNTIKVISDGVSNWYKI